MRIAEMGPEVSVVIPTRDALRWLPAAVASVGGDARVEIVVVDDRSKDGTADWLSRLAAVDPRVVPLPGKGRGAAAARNLGIDRARAPLVAFLEPNGTWAPGKLDAQLALHRTYPEIGFSFTDYGHVTEDGEARGANFAFWPRFGAVLPSRPSTILRGGALPIIYAENVVGCSTVVARTDMLRALGGFTTDLPSAEDWDMWLRLAAAAPVGVVNSLLATSTLHRTDNESGKLGARLAAMRVISRRHRTAVEALDREAVSACAVRLLVAEAEQAEGDGRWIRATRLRVETLMRAPCRRSFREAAAAAVRSLRPARPPGWHQAPAAR